MGNISTSRQLAEIAGVSHMTVSRAFRNDPKIFKGTRDRILALAREHGYRPNPLVALAMQSRRGEKDGEISGSLAFVQSNIHEDTWNVQPHLIPYLKGMRKRAAEQGFSIDEFWLSKAKGGLSPRRLTGILEARGICGLIIAPPPGFVKHMRLDWDRFSCVTFSHDSWRPLLHRVATDELHAMAITLRELGKLGYQRIGLAVAHNLDASSSHAFTGRFLAAQMNWKKSESVPPLVYRGPEIRDSAAEVLRWFKKYRPDCVICCDIATRQLLAENGARAPDDVGLAHLAIGPDVATWSGYNINRESIGAAAVDMAINRMVRNETGIPKDAREVLLRGCWQAGDSTRHAK